MPPSVNISDGLVESFLASKWHNIKTIMELAFSLWHILMNASLASSISYKQKPI